MSKPFVIFTKSVIKSIEHHVTETNNTEAGGILIGPPPVNDTFLITDQIADEGNPYRSGVAYKSDADYLQNQLRSIRLRYPGRDYRGTWHKHPGMTSPSGQDLRQALEILRDPDYRVDGRLIMPIVCGSGSRRQMQMTCYLIRTGDDDFTTIPYTVKDENDPELEILTALYTKCDRDKITDKPAETTTKTRLDRELQSLKDSGYNASAKQLDQDTVAIEIPLDDNRSLLVILPEEYPANPPRLVLVRQNRAEDVRWKFQPWSSAYFISDVVRQYLNQPSLEKPVRKALTGTVNVYSKITQIFSRR